MIQRYDIHNRTIVPAEPDRPGSVLVFVCRTEEDKEQALGTLGLDPHDVDSSLDPDEISRVDMEYGEDRAFIIWKQPHNVTFKEQLQFDVASVGLFLEPQRLSLVTSAEELIYFSPRDYRAVESPLDVLLRFLLVTTRHYLEHLKGVKLVVSELQAKINTSMGNKYLLQMFALSESLTYYMNAIEANATVLTKLHVNARKLKFSESQTELLDDIRLDNQQCARQAQIYSEVLAGLMDARGNIVNNNMTLLLRDLTLINIIFLPLNLIAGIGGMSEYTMMTERFGWRTSYALLLVAMVALGWLTWMVLVRVLRRR